MKTPKSAKKAAKAEALVAVETPVKTKTPKKAKTPKAAVETPKTPKAAEAPKTPKAEAVSKTPKTEAATPKTPEKMEVSDNGPKVNGGSKHEGFGGFRRGGFRGGRGRGGFRGGRMAGVKRDVNAKAVFVRFEDGITCDVAQALLDQFKDNEAVSFGRGFIVHFASLDAAAELKEKAMTMEFGGAKPKKTEYAYERVERTEKRPIAGGAESSAKKQKVGLTDVLSQP
ncbi:uncharacterized protein LOC135201062 isoform X3 [Macrobrachium nipponense]|uniref:uncharacterized protein LOC135201062 isoform X3 n=1 Tax=Macrobrachium nipponense TaxID=159736 RepID=UPI0030C80E1F